MLSIQGNSQPALSEVWELLLQLAHLRSIMLGPEHPDTLRTTSQLACIFWECAWWYWGEFDESTKAEAMLQEVLQAQERVLGPAHPDTHVTRVQLGICYTDQGKYEEAREVLRKAVQLSTEAFGSEHEETKWARDMLRQCDEREEEGEEDGEEEEEEQEEVSNAGGTSTICWWG
jgi:tetratricopeptide (TPR) repeat protein